MKFKFLIIACFLFVFSQTGTSQFTFSVSPGLSWTGAHVGYKVNSKIVPYFGLQYINASLNYDNTDEYYDGIQVISDDYDGELSAGVLIPTLGLKYFIIEKNAIRGYLNLNVSRPIIFGSAKDDGDTIDEFEDAIENISALGAEFGFGVEYFFSENFSVGGEYGIRYLNINVASSDTNTFLDNNGNQISVTDSYDVTGKISPTYSKIALNFYF